MKYTFGDTPTAEDRLKRIAEFFNPLSKDFVSQHINDKVDVACDLGCGPGYTSQMLQKATDAGITYGLDFSESFIHSAKKYFPDIKFCNQDITSGNFPEKADVIYCRFLLSHLSDIEKLVSHWLKQLKPGGQIYIDELEAIETSNNTFQKYLHVSNQLIRSQGANLYIGKNLDTLVKSFNVVYNESAIFPVQNDLAAWWFYPNTISVWRSDEFVKDLTTKSERETLSHLLFEMSQQKANKSEITWTMKRIIIKGL